MDISLSPLEYKFKDKPLLVGGKAMEYYGLRQSGDDIDFIATQDDVLNLIKKYPDRVKHLWGDLGVCPFKYEIWTTICLYGYEYLKDNSIEKDNYLIISKEKLLFMKALGMKKEKYLKDSQLLVASIFNDQSLRVNEIIQYNEQLIKTINGISYKQKIGLEKK